MSVSSIIALTVALFIVMIVAAGFASGNMPNSLSGLDARRDTAPFAFWLFTTVYLLGACLFTTLAIAGRGN
ncbi:hypothetical protein GCM10011395_26580 [Sphingomonas psychrolutea]|uniref:Uncharacterized protein n=1 Tax=Sphingomonas psychrolutea TaxID=1259676 RepID=A0ABQ1H0W2_9SPHN|nr:hypothetical protein GCM10011395_26580 [Sphingomonas psychrolutea]